MQGCKGWDALDHEVQSPATAGSGYVTASESQTAVLEKEDQNSAMELQMGGTRLSKC